MLLCILPTLGSGERIAAIGLFCYGGLKAREGWKGYRVALPHSFLRYSVRTTSPGSKNTLKIKAFLLAASSDTLLELISYKLWIRRKSTILVRLSLKITNSG
jgi:hypothetical protein